MADTTARKPLAPTVKVPGLGTLTLEHNATPADGRYVHAWRTVSVKSTESTASPVFTEEDETEVDPRYRYAVVMAAPIKDGKPVSPPASVTLSAFSTDAEGKPLAPKSLALTQYTRKGRLQRKNGAPVIPHVVMVPPPLRAGSTEYVRPNGARYVFAVKITPSADGSAWRIAASLAQ